MFFLQRDYSLTIQDAKNITKALEIKGLRVEFTITNSLNGGGNQALFTIYNLSTEHQNFLNVYKWDSTNVNKDKLRYVVFKAGYINNMSICFIGDLREGYSYRAEGQTDIITYLDCVSGMWAINNTDTNISLSSQINIKDVFQTLITSLTKGTNLSKGTITFTGDYKLSNGMVLQGNSYKQLKETLDKQIFVSNGELHAINKDEYLKGIKIISLNSNNIITSKRAGNYIIVSMAFEPNIALGHIVSFNSSIVQALNGQYKVVSIKHTGAIDQNKAENIITTLELFIGTGSLKVAVSTI